MACVTYHSVDWKVFRNRIWKKPLCSRLCGDHHEICESVIPEKWYYPYSCCMGHSNGSIVICSGALLITPTIDSVKALKYTNVTCSWDDIPVFCNVFKKIDRLFNWCQLLDGYQRPTFSDTPHRVSRLRPTFSTYLKI